MDTKTLVEKLSQRDLSDVGALRDYFESLKHWELENFEDAHRRMKDVRRISASELKKNANWKMMELYRLSLLFDAPYDFDAYCIYIELNRPPEKRFYAPRRKKLLRVVKAFQRLADDELDLLGVSLPPGVGKTTVSLFGITWFAGKHPEQPILGGSHSNAFLRGAYDECIRIMDPKGEYLWSDVFPNVKVIKTNAQDMMIDLGDDPKKGKRFSTLEFSSIGSGNAGKVRAEQLLYCDDLVDGLESALSKERMDKLWNLYATDLRQRKIGNCKELHVATRWSVHDVLGRLEQAYYDDPRAEFIVIPALDENDESNFDYGNHAGFTTKFYHEQREVMDDASWRALYMNQPIEREGQLYNEDELRRYFELPDREPDAILALCDTKDRGTDYCVMPVMYQYGNDYYMEDIVCSNGDEKLLEDLVATTLYKHKVQMCQFESNAAGGKIGDIVQEKIKKMGGITKITKKWTSANKETKIIVNSPFVLDRFLFKDNSVIKSNKTYRLALQMMCSYTMMGRNKHDDVVDAMAMAALYIQSLQGNKAQVINRPF